MTGRPLVCLVDSRDDGHHPMYAAVYAGVLRRLGCDVWLAATDGLIASMPAIEGVSDPAEGATGAGGSFTVRPWHPPNPSGTDRVRSGDLAARRWQAVGGLLDAASRETGRYPDIVLLLWFDDFITEVLPRQAIESRIRCPFVGLWFQPPPPWPRNWREAVKRLLRVGKRYPSIRSRLCAGILVLDASDATHLRSFGGSAVVEVPEVSTSRPPAVEPALVADVRRRAEGRAIFSLVGSLEGRKGLRPFLEAAAVAPTDEWVFVMAGKLQRHTIEPRTIKLLESLTSGRDARVLLVDRWLENETLDSIVACSNLLHVYYYDWRYSSNIICKAAACDVPVIGGTEGYIGRMIREYDLGFSVRRPADLTGRFVPGFAAEVAAFGGSVRFRDGCNRYRAVNNQAVLETVCARLLDRCRLRRLIGSVVPQSDRKACHGQ